jgi:hypothetical protein
MYLDTANYVKELHKLMNEELFELTVCDLLMIKAKGDESKIDELYKIYFNIIGKEWLDAKLIKSLSH